MNWKIVSSKKDEAQLDLLPSGREWKAVRKNSFCFSQTWKVFGREQSSYIYISPSLYTFPMFPYTWFERLFLTFLCLSSLFRHFWEGFFLVVWKRLYRFLFFLVFHLNRHVEENLTRYSCPKITLPQQNICKFSRRK